MYTHAFTNGKRKNKICENMYAVLVLTDKTTGCVCVKKQTKKNLNKRKKTPKNGERETRTTYKKKAMSDMINCCI